MFCVIICCLLLLFFLVNIIMEGSYFVVVLLRSFLLFLLIIECSFLVNCFVSLILDFFKLDDLFLFCLIFWVCILVRFEIKLVFWGIVVSFVLRGSERIDLLDFVDLLDFWEVFDLVLFSREVFLR